MTDIRLLRWLLAGTVLIFFGAWELLGATFGSVRLFVATPSTVSSYFVANLHELALDFLTTSLEALLGLAAAVGVGFAILFVSSRSKITLDYFQNLTLVIQVIPLVVFAPVVAIALGVDIFAKAFLAALVAGLPFVATVLAAFDRIPSALKRLTYIHQMSPQCAFATVYLPYLLPNIFAALRLCSTLAVLGAVIAEFSGATIGLGKNIFLASMRIEPELMMASIGLCIALSFLLYVGVAILERFFMPWIFEA
jgi:NitT/TauT family transport system permease protein